MTERLFHAFWPALTVFLLTAAPIIAGLDARFAPALRGWWILGGSVLVLVLLVWGVFGLEWPEPDEALARIDARLAGRPIAALRDQPAIGVDDPASGALWQAHLVRMARASRAARPVAPDLDVATKDRFGLRLVALLFFVTAVIFAPPAAIPGAGGSNARPGQTLASGPAWEGWVEPPAYTGKPTLYLADLPEGDIALAQDARITIRLYGEGDLQVEQSVADDAAEDGSFTITRDGRIAVLGDGGAEWHVLMQRDQPPRVRVSGQMQIEASGQMSQPFAAEDDHGVSAGQATFTLDPARVERRFGLTTDPDPRPALVVDLPMPFSGDRSEIEDVLIEDFSRHPFANLPVVMVLSARDALGQEGVSAPVEMVLPGRRFFQPVARAVIELRRDLLWSHANAPRSLDLLRAIAHRPEDLFPSPEVWDDLRDAISLLAESMAEDRLSEAETDIADALWEVALELEEGALAHALARLERAQERLSQAMRDGASPAEIADLMRELREATDDWLDLLAQHAEPAPDRTDQPQSGQEERERVSEDEIQALMDRIQELMEEGRMEEAEALMRQLDELLRNLQMQQEQNAGEGGRRQPGREQMQQMQETLRGQQDLSDDAFRELQDQFNNRSPDEGGGEGGEDEESLAARQQQLQQELERQREQLPGLTGEAAERARELLDRAGEAMERAADALEEGDLPGAIDHQAEALGALREGLEQLGRALAENERIGDEADRYALSEDGTGRPAPARRDPLGRQTGESGRHGSDQAMRDSPDPARRAQELLEELRRRAGERGREVLELDYLQRLLEQF